MKNKILQNDELSSFCTGISLLLHAGLNSGDGLHLLAQEDKSGHAELLSAMAEKSDGGIPLSEAMKVSGVFPDYAVGLTLVGEQSGRLEEAMRALADYYDGRARLSRRIRSALLYPAVLLFLMLTVIAVLLTKVLPVFSEVYASLGGKLTGFAGGLLSLGQWMDAAMPYLCAVLAAFAVLVAALAVSETFRSFALKGWRARHGGRGISRSVSTARFARALSMGMRSGMPAEDAMRLAASLQSDNPFAAKQCAECLARLEKGSGLTEALNASGVLPPSYCSILALGIRGGSGDTVMENIAQRLEEESGEAIDAKVGRVEPSLVILTSVLVGIILLSVMLPLMNIMTAIG